MRVFSNYISPNVIKEKMYKLSYLDFSLFYEYFPNDDELSLSKINILVINEPNEYTGMLELVIKEHKKFTYILSWNDNILSNCVNSVGLLFGSTFLKEHHYVDNKIEKKFGISFIRGNLMRTYGHQLRFDIYSKKDLIKIPTLFYDTYRLDNRGEGKYDVIHPYKYHLVIENVSHPNFFTEKLIDCFLLKSIPVYYGCTNINDYFHIDERFIIKNTSDFFNLISKEFLYTYYDESADIIEENYTTALNYCDYLENMTNLVESLI